MYISAVVRRGKRPKAEVMKRGPLRRFALNQCEIDIECRISGDRGCFRIPSGVMWHLSGGLVIGGVRALMLAVNVG